MGVCDQMVSCLFKFETRVLQESGPWTMFTSSADHMINHALFRVSNDLEESAASEQAYDFMPMKIISMKILRKFANVQTDSYSKLRT